MYRTLAATLLTTSTLIPAAALAQPAGQQQQPAATDVNLCRELVVFIERRGNAQPASPVTLDQARGFEKANNIVACRDAALRVQSAGITLPAALVAVVRAPGGQAGAEGTNIVVQQPAPAIRVDQAAPQVTVQQAQPQVTVRQPQPEILVRQPAPTVTVDIPQPEITVRMPRPDVDVAMAQPQVQVTQPRPQVQVVQPERPQVQVQPAQPQVMIQRDAGAQANVDIQASGQQPTVRYERAEPRVVVNQAQGSPTIRMEQASETAGPASGQARAPDGMPQGSWRETCTGARMEGTILRASCRTTAGAQIAAALDLRTCEKGVVANMDGQLRCQNAVQGAAVTDPVERRRLARERIGEDATAAMATSQRAIRVSDLENLNLYNARGEQLGDVERVIMDPSSKRQYVVIARGGFLGLFQDEVAIPMERIAMRGDRLVVRGITDQELDALEGSRRQMGNARELEDNASVNLGAVQ